MKGSEKQIKWAEDIKANLVKTYMGVIPMMPEADRPKMEKAIEMLNSIEQAGIIIEAYKAVKFSGVVQKDIMAIMTTHRNMTPAELANFMPM